MVYGAITQALSERTALQASQDRLTSLQKSMSLMALDFTQLTPLPVRAPVGDGWQPALSAEGGANPLVTFTRSGWANPAGIQRPALQRVSYVLEGKKLRREHSSVLDATLASRVVQRELLDKVETATFRYMDGA